MPSPDHRPVRQLLQGGVARWRTSLRGLRILFAISLALTLALALALAPPSWAAANTDGPSSSSADCTPISRAAVEGLFERWEHAIESGDPGQVAALYSDDALLLPTLSDQPRDTPQAIRAYFDGFLARSPRGRIDSRRIHLGCNQAVAAGTYSFLLSDPDGGPPAWVQARYTFVYGHGPDGWRIQHHHSSLQPPG